MTIDSYVSKELAKELGMVDSVCVDVKLLSYADKCYVLLDHNKETYSVISDCERYFKEVAETMLTDWNGHEKVKPELQKTYQRKPFGNEKIQQAYQTISLVLQGE